MAYDPSQGPPTWPSADTPTLEAFEVNKQRFLEWNAAAGLIREVSPGTFTNTIPFSATLPTPQQVRNVVIEARAALPAGVSWPAQLLPAIYEQAGASIAPQQLASAVAAAPALQLQAGTAAGMLAQLLERYKTPAIVAAVLLVILLLFWRR